MSATLFLLEDEPLILMDLEFAAEDEGCRYYSAVCQASGLKILEEAANAIDGAILDVSLGEGQTCFPVAQRLRELRIPFILHSADLDRHDERIRDLNARLVPKPAPVEKVIDTALREIRAKP